jgi:hypothetical protein
VTRLHSGSYCKFELDVGDCARGFAVMKKIIRQFAFCYVLIISIIAGLHAMACCARAQHDVFDEGVIQKWKDYESFSTSLQGTMRSQQTRNGKQLEEIIGRIRQNRECALVIEPYSPDPSFLSYTLINPRYRATLNVSKSDPGNAIIRKYTPLSEDREALSLFDNVYVHASRHFYYGGTIRLRQAISDSSFKVTKVAKEDQNGQELVRIDHNYNYTFHLANQDHEMRAHGTIWFDPLRCWCIRRFNSSYEERVQGERISETEKELTCETADHPSGFPILKRTTEHFKLLNFKNKQKVEGTKKTDYELEVNDNVPNSEFTLSAFGLPEPGGEESVKKPVPTYVWILIAAGLCGALAFGFRSLARRRRRVAAA